MAEHMDAVRKARGGEWYLEAPESSRKTQTLPWNYILPAAAVIFLVGLICFCKSGSPSTTEETVVSADSDEDSDLDTSDEDDAYIKHDSV